MMTQTLQRVAHIVENRLASLFEDVANNPVSTMFNTRISPVTLEQVRDLTMRGGKRLRATLLVQSAALFDASAEQQPSVIDAAAAIELLHTYFLIHDDIMDDDDMRRGGPSVHAALAKQTGSQRLGQGLAILAGDLADSLKQILLTGMDIDDSRRHKIDRIFAAMHLDVVHGQTLDMLRNSPALEIAARKTASYTTIGPIAAGAAAAGASKPEIDRLAALARPLGIAFQLRDDLLGVFGDPKSTGKPIGTDLKENKQTFLLEQGFARANPDQKKRINFVLGRPDASVEDLNAACDALAACGAKTACESRVDLLVNEFKTGLKQGQYLPQGKEFLLEVARYIGHREG